jgi:hypothetical protein
MAAQSRVAVMKKKRRKIGTASGWAAMSPL